MSDQFPRVNLGQSEFQDTYFVAGAEESPFRRLRKIELQINEIENSIKHSEFQSRKNVIKIKRLNPEDELEAIEIEEIEWGMKQGAALLNDAYLRLDNFLKLKEECMHSMPNEYWDAGYEAAELSHWVNYYSKKLCLEQMSGQPQLATIEQVMLLPKDVIKDIFKLRNQEMQALMLEVKAD